MELTFTKVGNTYIADFQATKDFNIHIEGGGRIVLYKRTSGTIWNALASEQNRAVLDADIQVGRQRDYRIAMDDRAPLVMITFADGTSMEGVIPL